MELIEKCEEKLEKKSNLIIFSFGGIFCEFLARRGVGQGLSNGKKIYLISTYPGRSTRTKMNE